MLGLQRYDFDLNEFFPVVDPATGDLTKRPHPRNPDPSLYQTGQHPTATFHRAGWHAIVEAADCYIDFTARQYHHEAAYPTIIQKKAAAAAAGGE